MAKCKTLMVLVMKELITVYQC